MRDRRAAVVSTVLIAVAMIRIAATLPVLSATTDEPVHVTAGIELLLQHRYKLLPVNPPLPGILFAAPIVAAGADFDPQHDAKHFVGATFYSRGHYRTNLVLARMGNLLFFAIAAVCVWKLGGVLATLLFAMQPLILGFAGIANHDMPATAGTALALLAYWRWMERRTVRRALLFGLAYGLSMGLKFSCIAFVPAACAALYITRLFFDAELRRDWRAALIALPVAAVAAAFALAATYGFMLEPFRTGLTGLIALARKGRFDSYALGRWSPHGFWWYFPLAIAVKTTLASLLLLFFVPRRRETYLPWLAAALAILVLVLPSRLDLGVRYVLPMYVPLTMAMACAASEMLQHARRAIRGTAVALLLWHCGSSLLAHPQYFAYFNVLAGPDPSRVLVDSNLDWGQDALILKKVLREKKADAVGLALVGMHDYRLLGYPVHYPVTPDVPATGWVAIGDHFYRWEPWPWLRGRKYQRVGAGVRLYYIPHR